ncbi:MAG: hypothetical protein BRD48_03645 [Bacteroidetes bacterium QS_9_68_14]|nr:MAG: hypothetical protein BRD48_03645 [Bacteroidetes bacterium QS_9_68_14]
MHVVVPAAPAWAADREARITERGAQAADELAAMLEAHDLDDVTAERTVRRADSAGGTINRLHRRRRG